MFAKFRAWKQHSLQSKQTLAASVARSRHHAVEPLESRAMLAATPQLVVDLTAGGDSEIFRSVAVDDSLFFNLGNGVHPLWSTNGTAAGTTPIVSSDLDSTFTFAGEPVRFHDDVYFSSLDSDGRFSLWKVNPQNNQASKIWSQVPIEDQNWISNISPAGNSLYFTAQRVNGTTDLWKTDGSPAGTTLVTNLPVRYTQQLTDVNGTLFFATGHEDMEQPKLWKSDGTAAGTTVVADGFRSDDDVPGPRQLTKLNGLLYFVADDPQHGAELWRSDGTREGTFVVVDLNPGIGNGLPGYGYGQNSYKNFVVVDDTLYFSGNDGVNGFELWASDGTAAGTRRITDLAPGGMSSFPDSITATSLGIYFAAFETDVSGPSMLTRLWRTDGTAASTQMIADVDVRELVNIGDTLFFGGYVAGDVERLWSSDGTAAGTALVRTDPTGPQPIRPGSLQVVGDQLLFTAEDGEHGEEWWVLSPSVTDLDRNFRVDVRDLAILVGNFGTAADAEARGGDFDGDGRVGLRELIAMRNQLDQPAFPVSAAAVVARLATSKRLVHSAALEAVVDADASRTALASVRASRVARVATITTSQADSNTNAPSIRDSTSTLPVAERRRR